MSVRRSGRVRTSTSESIADTQPDTQPPAPRYNLRTRSSLTTIAETPRPARSGAKAVTRSDRDTRRDRTPKSAKGATSLDSPHTPRTARESKATPKSARRSDRARTSSAADSASDISDLDSDEEAGAIAMAREAKEEEEEREEEAHRQRQRQKQTQNQMHKQKQMQKQMQNTDDARRGEKEHEGAEEEEIRQSPRHTTRSSPLESKRPPSERRVVVYRPPESLPLPDAARSNIDRQIARLAAIPVDAARDASETQSQSQSPSRKSSLPRTIPYTAVTDFATDADTDRPSSCGVVLQTSSGLDDCSLQLAQFLFRTVCGRVAPEDVVRSGARVVAEAIRDIQKADGDDAEDIGDGGDGVSGDDANVHRFTSVGLATMTTTHLSAETDAGPMTLPMTVISMAGTKEALPVDGRIHSYALTHPDSSRAVPRSIFSWQCRLRGPRTMLLTHAMEPFAADAHVDVVSAMDLTISNAPSVLGIGPVESGESREVVGRGRGGGFLGGLVGNYIGPLATTATATAAAVTKLTGGGSLIKRLAPRTKLYDVRRAEMAFRTMLGLTKVARRPSKSPWISFDVMMAMRTVAAALGEARIVHGRMVAFPPPNGSPNGSRSTTAKTTAMTQTALVRAADAPSQLRQGAFYVVDGSVLVAYDFSLAHIVGDHNSERCALTYARAQSQPQAKDRAGLELAGDQVVAPCSLTHWKSAIGRFRLIPDGPTVDARVRSRQLETKLADTYSVSTDDMIREICRPYYYAGDAKGDGGLRAYMSTDKSAIVDIERVSPQSLTDAMVAWRTDLEQEALRRGTFEDLRLPAVFEFMSDFCLVPKHARSRLGWIQWAKTGVRDAMPMMRKSTAQPGTATDLDIWEVLFVFHRHINEVQLAYNLAKANTILTSGVSERRLFQTAHAEAYRAYIQHSGPPIVNPVTAAAVTRRETRHETRRETGRETDDRLQQKPWDQPHQALASPPPSRGAVTTRHGGTRGDHDRREERHENERRTRAPTTHLVPMMSDPTPSDVCRVRRHQLALGASSTTKVAALEAYVDVLRGRVAQVLGGDHVGFIPEEHMPGIPNVLWRVFAELYGPPGPGGF